MTSVANTGIIARVKNYAQKQPNTVAVKTSHCQLTYKELDEKSDCLAQLILEKNCGEEFLVAIVCQRNPDDIISLVATLKAGGTYTFVENLNEGSLSTTLEKDVDLVVVNSSIDHNVVTSNPLIHIKSCTFEKNKGKADTKICREIPQGRAVYVVYTSGSTGKPKGVEVVQENILCYVDGFKKRLVMSQLSRFGHVSSLSADLGNTSIFLSLLHGRSLCFLDDNERRSSELFFSALTNQGIDVLKITPSHWTAMLAVGSNHLRDKPFLKYLILGGEKLERKVAYDALSSAFCEKVINHYGPSETTIGVCCHVLTSVKQLGGEDKKFVPIGKPLKHVSYLLRTNGKFGRGNSGELCIVGKQVAKGYRNEIEKTKEKFVVAPGIDGSIYLTGDHVRVDSEGDLHFEHRLDRQVKINGFRIELGAIETLIRDLLKVGFVHAFTLTNRGRERILVAYKAQKSVTPADLKNVLEKSVPFNPSSLIFKAISSNLPLTENGKVDLKFLEKKITDLFNQKSEKGHSFDFDDPGKKALYKCWVEIVGSDNFSEKSNFFESGGDSLDAIMLLSSLSSMGYEVPSHYFIDNPTFESLYHHISYHKKYQTIPETGKPEDVSFSLSEAQKRFFNSSFVDSNHWNQSVVLGTRTKLNSFYIKKTVRHLLTKHPLLRTTYHSKKPRVLNSNDLASESCFREISVEAEKRKEENLYEVMYRESNRVQKNINTSSGPLFCVNLIRSSNGSNIIMFISHHLCVDGVSWRIIIRDFCDVYRRVSQNTRYRAVEDNGYFQWVNHLNKKKKLHEESCFFWLENLSDLKNVTPYTSATKNIEGAASSQWVHINGKNYNELKKTFPVDTLFMALFAHAYCEEYKQNYFYVDVESHGRVTVDNKIDVSGSVGWFTSTYPLLLPVTVDDLEKTVAAFMDISSKVPNLGVGFSLYQHEIVSRLPRFFTPPVCFNFLGDVDIGKYSGGMLEQIPFQISSMRGEKNNLEYLYKVTCRAFKENVIVELCSSTTTTKMSSLLSRFKRNVSNFLSYDAQDRMSSQPRVGVLNFVPDSYLHSIRDLKNTRKKVIMLTGATGYVGSHLLLELLSSCDAKIICIVKHNGIADPYSRLQEVFDWYFPKQPLRNFGQRITVVEGYLTEPKFGWSENFFAKLSLEVSEVYHAAANTRLFSDPETVISNNVNATKQIISFCQKSRTKSLFFISTLAVSGINGATDKKVFDETSFYIGQHFQNPYEKSKYMSEKLVRDYACEGGKTMIFRAGNVSAHSKTGRFMFNAEDNRLIQFIRGTIALGELPSKINDELFLSPVDLVAEAIVKLSQSHVSPSSTFHVDTDISLPLRHIFDTLSEIGIPFRTKKADSFATLFRSRAGEKNKAIQMGLFWSSRSDRNIEFDRSYTLDTLRMLDIKFPRLDNQWLLMFFKELLSRGVLTVESGVTSTKLIKYEQ